MTDMEKDQGRVATTYRIRVFMILSRPSYRLSIILGEAVGRNPMGPA
jgi:hypothetical protein